jgi:arylsulfatase A-like enzyme
MSHCFHIKLLASVAIAAWFGCAPTDGPGARPVDTVILVSIDSLRADHLGAYGYRRPTSPTIDQLAAAGTVFERAYSTTSWTLPAHAALLTGLDDYTHGATDSRKKLAASFDTLAEALARAGVRSTGFFSGPFLHPSFGFGQGFDEYVDCTSYQWTGLQQGKRIPHTSSHRDVTNPILLTGVEKWLAERRPHARNLIFVHMWDVHADYRAPDAYGTLFDPNYDESDLSGQLEERKRVEVELTAGALRKLLARYDAEIRYTDETLRDLLDHFRRNGLLDNAAVIILADHGEEFFDHGRKGHRRTLYEEVLRVPLILHFPGAPTEARRVPDIVSLIDVFPTVCELMGVDCEYAGPGVSLVAFADGRRPENARGDALAELTTRAFGVDQTALVREDGKLIRWNTSGDLRYFDLRGVAVESRGVDVDPEQTSGEASPMTSALRQLRRRAADARNHAEQPRDAAEDSNSEAAIDPATEEHLRALGYVE